MLTATTGCCAYAKRDCTSIGKQIQLGIAGIHTATKVNDTVQDAEAEQAARGDASDLHVLIFDEIDAICKARGSVRDGSGVHDTVVNQLLTKIDGVDALNNILLIGMTNRCGSPWHRILEAGGFQALGGMHSS